MHGCMRDLWMCIAITNQFGLGGMSTLPFIFGCLTILNKMGYQYIIDCVCLQHLHGELL